MIACVTIYGVYCSIKDKSLVVVPCVYRRSNCCASARRRKNMQKSKDESELLLQLIS
jgi:hypothetical protein